MTELILLFIFSSYVWGTRYKLGRIDSISISYYLMKDPWRHLFTVYFCWGMAITLAIGYLGISGFFFIPVTCLMLLGAAAMYRKENVVKYHIAGAVGSIVSSVAAIWITYGWIPMVLVLSSVVSAYFGFKGRDNKTWWVEVIAFYAILVALVVYKYLIK